jgi:hypothetical protein
MLKNTSVSSLVMFIVTDIDLSLYNTISYGNNDLALCDISK